jgi:phosphonate transport system substrate-binding protein
LKSVQNLRGQTVAGIDPLALAVNETVLWLRKQGLRAGTDYTLLETASPISAAYLVKNHQSAMAISSPQGLKQLPDELREGLEVFATLPQLPSLMWLAHPRMKSEAARIKSALLRFTPQTSEGALFYDATGYIGMREVTLEETRAMDALAQEVSTLLDTKK